MQCFAQAPEPDYLHALEKLAAAAWPGVCIVSLIVAVSASITVDGQSNACAPAAAGLLLDLTWMFFAIALADIVSGSSSSVVGGFIRSFAPIGKVAVIANIVAFISCSSVAPIWLPHIAPLESVFPSPP